MSSTCYESVSSRDGSLARWTAPLRRSLNSLRHAILWPLRVLQARRELETLAAMSENELKDIGLTRSDLGDATALPADASPTDFLAVRVEERHRARHWSQPVRSSEHVR